MRRKFAQVSLGKWIDAIWASLIIRLQLNKDIFAVWTNYRTTDWLLNLTNASENSVDWNFVLCSMTSALQKLQVIIIVALMDYYIV